MDGNAEVTASQIPQGAVDDRQRAVGQLGGAAPLPMGQFLPQPLTVERVLPDENLRDEFLDDMRPNDLWWRKAIAGAAIVGDHREQGEFHLMRRTGMCVAGTVRMTACRVLEHLDADIDDPHRFLPLLSLPIPAR